VGHPNVGKTSLLNALVGRKVASVSHTPGHTKHLQSWQLTPEFEVVDCPGLVFPVGGELIAGSNVAPRHVFEICGLYPIAQVREPYSGVRLLGSSLDLRRLYGLSPRDIDEADEEEEHLSPLGFCTALAAKRGYRMAKGRGAPDPHRAGLEILTDAADGVLCLAFDPPRV